MPRSPRIGPQAPHSCLRSRGFGLLLAGATLALAWPLAAAAQDGDASVQQERSLSALIHFLALIKRCVGTLILAWFW